MAKGGEDAILAAMFAPFTFLDEEALPLPATGPQLFLSHAVRCEIPVESSSLSCKFVLDGEETYVINGRAHRLLAGDFIIVDAGVEGSIDIPRRERTIAMSAFFGKHLGDALLPGYGPVMRPPAAGALGKLLRRTAATYASNPDTLPKDACPLIRQIMTATRVLAMDMQAKLETVSLSKPRSRQDLLMRLEKARTYLDEKVAASVTLADLSRNSGISPFHLVRHFKSVFGEPPMRYHRRIQMERMAQLLANGEITPSAAAEMLDYNDLPSFSRAFKGMIGAPPSALQQR